MQYKPANIRASIDKRRASLRIANAAIVQIGRRAFDEGRGVDDQPHEPYSRRYAAKKAGTGHGRVDLTVTGRMRRSLRAEPQPDGATLVRIRGVGNPAYTVHTNARRPWFGLSRSDRNVLEPIVRRIVRESITFPGDSR